MNKDHFIGSIIGIALGIASSLGYVNSEVVKSDICTPAAQVQK